MTTPRAPARVRHCSACGSERHALVETAPGLRARVILQSRLIADAVVVLNVYMG
jgi:hypothetical protein